MRPEPGGPSSGGLEAITRPSAGLRSLHDSVTVLEDGERRTAALERDGRPVATGFLVGPDLLLTVGHAVCAGTGPASVAGTVAVFDHREGTGAPPGERGVRVPLAELLCFSPPADTDPGTRGLPTAREGLDFAYVRLAFRPPDAPARGGGSEPRGWYRLRPGRHDFRRTEQLHLFHHAYGQSHRHTTATFAGLTDHGRRLRHTESNTEAGSSGAPVVTPDGRLVAMHQGRMPGTNENRAVPTGLIAEALLAGPYGEELRRFLDGPAPPSPSQGAPYEATAQGAAATAGMLRPLLGPSRSHVTLPGPAGAPVRAVTAREAVEAFRPHEPLRRSGAGLVAEAARTTARSAGDGTVTAAVLAGALVTEAARRRAAGAAPYETARSVTAAAARVRAELDRLTEPCTDPLPVARSATADEPLAAAVADAARRAGPHGVLLCEPGDTRAVETVVHHGLRLPAGYLSPRTVTDPWTGRVCLERPYVLLLAATEADPEALRRLVERIRDEERSLLILTAARDTEAHTGLLRTLHALPDHPVPPVVRVASDTGQHHRLRALTVLTGARPITADDGPPAGSAWYDHLGRAELALVSASETVLVHDPGRPADVSRWIASTRRKRELAASGRERAALDELVAWLSSRATIVRVGADTESGLASRTAAAERAARSAQAALRSGTLAGGGLALLRSGAVLSDTAGEPGADILRAALAVPFRLLAAPRVGAEEIERFVASDGAAPLPAGFSHPGDPVPRDAAEVVRAALDSALAALGSFLGSP